MGVRRAMEIVLGEVNKGNGPLSTYGPLIHNKQVLDLLESKGVRPVKDLQQLSSGRIVIRAHGIPPKERQALKKTGLNIIDATCPKVTRVQAIIRHQTSKGYSAIIVGDPDHAEVIGLVGYSRTTAFVIQDPRDVSRLPDLEQAFVVAQTTQNEQNFRNVVTALKTRFPQVLVFDTICDTTQHRQKETKSFAGQVDAVVVVGGYHSGNTQRLVQVSREAGMQTFHIETEKELEKQKLSGMEVIGVTAGASTPSWMINNVVREIQGIRGRRETFINRWLKQAFNFLVLSNIAVALGAFSFAYAIDMLSQRNPDFTFPSLTFFYIYAMHVLNRFLDKGASAYNDPERASFLHKYRTLLVAMGIASTAVALVASFRIGATVFLAVCGLSILGIIYSIPLLPARIRGRYRFSKIKDIPGSRSLAQALAWMTLIAILPLLETDRILWPPAIISLLVVLLMSYTRSALFDTFQAQGDLIVGTETLPITLGERRTLVLLKVILSCTAFILIGALVLGLVGPFAYPVLLSLIGLSFCLFCYERRWLHPGITFEALIEAIFFLSGLITLVWMVL